MFSSVSAPPCTDADVEEAAEIQQESQRLMDALQNSQSSSASSTDGALVGVPRGNASVQRCLTAAEEWELFACDETEASYCESFENQAR